MMSVYATELKDNWATLESVETHERAARNLLQSKAQLRFKQVRALAS